MRIKSGTTRVVLLIGNRAIKFGRIRLLRLIFRILLFPFMSKRNHMLFYESYGEYLFLGMVNYLLVGIEANRTEYQYYQTTKDIRVAPTRKMYLLGWIIVQDRGEPISQNELEKDNPFKDIFSQEFSEKKESWQFCKIHGKIVLADYGRKKAVSAFCLKA